MSELHLQFLRVERPDPAEDAAAARERLRDRFNRGTTRRMSHLALLLGSVLGDCELHPEDAIVYATTFGGTRALEDYLNGMPVASPTLFQTSIHPGALQQVLIARQQPVRRLWPLAGRSRLIEQALLMAQVETAPRVIVVGGEERGTWMLEMGMASDRAFAFAMVLTRQEGKALGRLQFLRETDQPPADEPCPGPVEFVDLLAERRPVSWHGAGGAWSLNWQ